MIQRAVIHQAIDRLPDNLLLELFQFIQTLWAKIQPNLPERDSPTPEEVVAKIQQLPPNPTTFHPAIGSLAEALTRPHQTEPFNVQAWNDVWDKMEAEMKTQALMHEGGETVKNMAEYLLDTNHLLPLVTLEHPLRLKVLAAVQTGDTFSIAVPALAEFLLGIGLISCAKQNKQEWEYLAKHFNYRAIDQDDAAQAAELCLSLRKQGWQLAMLNAFIAVVALRYNLILLTTDKDFRAVPHLRYENWRI